MNVGAPGLNFETWETTELRITRLSPLEYWRIITGFLEEIAALARIIG